MEKTDSDQVWSDLAALIASLEAESRTRYQLALSRFAHDLRNSIAQIYTAEMLLRRTDLAVEDITVLNTLRDATCHALERLSSFAYYFDANAAQPPTAPGLSDNS